MDLDPIPARELELKQPARGEVLPRDPHTLGLVVLTRDAELLETLERLAADEYRLHVVAAETDLATALMDPGIGVALIDAASVSSELPDMTRRLRSQFPELVLVVAGGPQDQSALASHVASGAVYRFLHKPVSEQRVKLFIDAAMRRHGEVETQASVRPQAPPSPPRGSSRERSIAIGAAALLIVGGCIAWLLLRSPAGKPSAAHPGGAAAAQQPAGDPRLAAAREAIARGELVAPAGTSAADLYRSILAKSPDNAEARDGLERVIDQLCSLAEREIAAGRLDDAARFVESARRIDPRHVRVSFLTTQIAKERERATLAEARQAAAGGNFQRAIQVLAGSSNSAVVADARRDLEQQELADRVHGLLKLAAERIVAGALLEPTQDNARFYLESARTLAPGDPLLRQTERELHAQLLAKARVAASSGDFGGAESLLQGAEESGASSAEVATVRTDIRHAQANAQTENINRLAQLFNERIQQNRLLEPANDSARYYYNALRQADASHPATEAAQRVLAKQLLDAARAALAAADLPAAERALGEATAVGAAPTDVAAAQHELDAAREHAAHAEAVISASRLERVKYVAPRYPDAARSRSLNGWVDLEFTVKADGAVSNVKVKGAEPHGVFEQVAVDAVSAWRFRPVLRDGTAVEQRAALRIRFALEN